MHPVPEGTILLSDAIVDLVRRLHGEAYVMPVERYTDATGDVQVRFHGLPNVDLEAHKCAVMAAHTEAKEKLLRGLMSCNPRARVTNGAGDRLVLSVEYWRTGMALHALETGVLHAGSITALAPLDGQPCFLDLAEFIAWAARLSASMGHLPAGSVVVVKPPANDDSPVTTPRETEFQRVRRVWREIAPRITDRRRGWKVKVEREIAEITGFKEGTVHVYFRKILKEESGS